MSIVIEEDFEGFDWDSTEGDRQYTPLPAGWYPVRISKAEMKTVAGREGEFRKLAMTMEVLNGPNAGRLIFDDIMLTDKEGSKKRRALVWRRLGLVEKGAQRASISEHDLIGRQCEVEVKVEAYPKRDGTTGQKNVVTFGGYKPIDRPVTGEGAVTTQGGEISENSCPF